MSMMPTCCINNTTLQGFREAHVAAKMQEYHARMKEVFEEGLKGLDVEKMKKDILEKVTKKPWDATVEVSYEFPLDKLFIPRGLYVDGEDGQKKYITNTKEPLECWMKNTGVMTSKEYTHVYRLYEGSSSYDDQGTRKLWEDYLYTADPETQALRKRLQEEFPDAEMHPMVYGRGMDSTVFRIAIIHRMPSQINGSESVAKPFRTSSGGFVHWEKTPKSEYGY